MLFSSDPSLTLALKVGQGQTPAQSQPFDTLITSPIIQVTEKRARLIYVVSIQKTR